MDESYKDLLYKAINTAKRKKDMAEDSETARYWAIQITELEKVYASYMQYLFDYD